MSSNKIKFRVSGAGIAGDPHRLLIGKFGDIETHQLFNSRSLLSLRWNRFKIKRTLELLSGARLV